MIVALVAALVCGEELVIEEVRSSSSRVQIDARITLVPGVETTSGHTGKTLSALGRFAPLVTWEPDSELELRLGARGVGVLSTARDPFAFLEPRMSLRWRGDTTEIAFGWDDRLRWSTLVDPLPTDLRLGPLPITGEADDRHRSIPFVSARHAIGALTLETLWQPLWVQATGAGADVDDGGLAQGGAGARVGWRDDAWDASASWLWRRAPAEPFERQHSLGVELGFTTGVVHWRAEGAWHTLRSDWIVDEIAHDGGSFDGLLVVSASPSIVVDGEIGVRTATSPQHTQLWLRLQLLMAYDGVLRLDVEGRLGLDHDEQQLGAALVLRAGRRVEIAAGCVIFEGNAVDGGLGALYDARDQIWLRLTLDL